MLTQYVCLLELKVKVLIIRQLLFKYRFDWFTAPWYLSEYIYSHMGLSDYKTHFLRFIIPWSIFEHLNKRPWY
jgi:hypothetical protein